MLRTFLALDLEEPFLREVLALIEDLRGERLPHVRWVTAPTIHVTLRFLGDIDEALVPALGALVTRVGGASTSDIELHSTSLLAFPNARRARVLALGLEDGERVSELAAAVEDGVRSLGLPPEKRSFRAHLTLARFREPADLRRLFAARSEAMRGGRLTALALYKSVLGSGPPTYTALARVPLGRGGDPVT